MPRTEFNSTHHMASNYFKIAMLGYLNLTSVDEPKICLSDMISIRWKPIAEVT